MAGKIRTLIDNKIAAHTWSDLELWLIGRGDVGESDPRNTTGSFSRMIWIHQGTGDDRKIGTAVVSTSSGIRYDKKSLKNCINLECWVGKPDTADPDSKTLYVKELSPKAIAALDGLSPMEQFGNEALFTDPANLTNMRVEVNGTLEITVTRGTYKRPSDGNMYMFNEGRSGFGTGNDSVAAIQAALTSGQHCVAWVAVARETGKIKVVASSAATAVGTLPQRTQLISTIFATSVTTTYKSIVPIYLYYGQTSVAEADVYRQFDARLDDTAGASGGGGIGNVVNSGASTDNAVPRFVGTSGTQIENTGVLIGDTGALTVPGTITLNIGSGSVIMSHAGAATTTTLTLPQRTTGLIITTPGASTDNVIQPSGDFPALVLKNNASQTANILEHHPSGSSIPLWSVSPDGHFGLGVATAATEVFRLTKTFADPATTSRAVNINPTMSLSTNGANGIRGFNVIATVAPGGNTASSAFAAIAGQGVVTTSGSGSVTGAIVGLYAQVQNGGTVVLSNGTGLNIDSATNAGTYTNNRGVVVAAQTAGSNNTYILLGTGTSPSGNWTIHATTTNNSALAGGLTVGATSAPVGTLNPVSTTGAIVTIARNDTSVDSGDTIGLIQFWGNDTQLSTQNIFANIEVQAAQTITTDAAAGKLIVRVTGTGAGGSPVEQFNLIDGTLTLKDALNIAVNTSTGTKIGTATTQKLGLWNATPVVQPASANQAAVATTAATQTTPWGYSTQAQADGIITLLNELRSALVSIGAIKGSA
jgi:hypothetical protein